jgi:hypothetical protein
MLFAGLFRGGVEAHQAGSSTIRFSHRAPLGSDEATPLSGERLLSILRHFRGGPCPRTGYQRTVSAESAGQRQHPLCQRAYWAYENLKY